MDTLQDLIRDLKLRSLNFRPNFDPKQFASTWLEDDAIDVGKGDFEIVNSLVVILRTHGCSWSHRSDSEEGGCSMCGYYNDTLKPGQTVHPKDILNQFQAALDKFQDKQFKIIKIFTSGSFLDDSEVPLETQAGILDKCDTLNVKNIILESRPEYVELEKLKELSTHFSGNLQIALGLESANDSILENVINKGFHFQDYITAANIAKQLEIGIKTYLLLKPPFLTERDAITDVLQSIAKLRELNLTTSISINPVNIQKFTVVEYLFNRGDYRVPWLWSVVEILKQGHTMLSGTGIKLISQPTAGGFRRGAHNCGKCDKLVLDAILNYSLNNNPIVFQELTCSCHDTWRDIIDLENIVKSNLDPISIYKK